MRGLGLIDLTAVLQIGVRPAGADADVLAAEQPLRLDAREAVVGDLVELRVEAHGDHRLVVLGSKRMSHFADAHPRHGDGRPDLEIADVVELARSRDSRAWRRRASARWPAAASSGTTGPRSPAARTTRCRSRGLDWHCMLTLLLQEAAVST